MATTAQLATVTNLINTLITDQHNEEITGTVMNTVLHAIKALAPSAYTGDFDNADLDGEFTIDIEHNLNTLLPDVKVVDNTGRILAGANIEAIVIDADNVRIGLGTSISGTYKYIILKHD